MTAATPACPYLVMPQFLPEWESEGFWLEARDLDSQPAFAIGARLEVGRFDAVLRSMPGALQWTHKPETCGRLLFNGGQWISPDFRGRSLSPLTCKILHAVALLLYDFDHIFALVVPEMHGGGSCIAEDSLSWRQGFRHCAPGIRWTGYYDEPQHLSLISMSRDEAVQSLS